MRFFFSILCFISPLFLMGQTTLTWDEMADVSFNGHFDAGLGIEVQVVEFSSRVSELEGQEVFVTGYMIPIDPLGTRYVLSRFQNANCFFCGNAGPETIIELRMNKASTRRYATDTYATFSGLLELNPENLTAFNYVLLEADKR